MNRYEERIARLRAAAAQAGVDAYFITNPSNVAYFTGTKGNECSLLITQNDAVIITDFRYMEMALSLSWFRFEETKLSRTIEDIINADKSVRIGIERNSMSLNQYLRFKDKLIGKEIVPIGSEEEWGGLVEELRIVKDDYEKEMTAKAEQIGCDAFNHIITYIKPGMTEKQVALELEHYMLSHGAEGLSFDTICVAGAKSSLPHGVPDETVIREGDFLTMDFGCKYKGYCSDMTRTVAIGYATDEMKQVYDVVLRAQLNACANIKAGIIGDVGHRLASDIIEAAGYGACFGHGLGHGTGLDIHEAPRLSPSYKKEIPEGSIVSVEPGIYLPGKFGVRIEDLAIVTGNGIINLASSAPKELIIIK